MSSRDLTLCDQEPKPQATSDIVLCDRQPKRTSPDIILCEDDCASVASLELVAPGAFKAGECFAVKGGKAPFIWESSGGIEVSPVGCILSIVGCDFSVTVTDACGQTDQISEQSHNISCPDGYGPEEITLVGPDPLSNGTYSISGAPAGARFMWGGEGMDIDVAPGTLSAVVSGLGGCEASLSVASEAGSSAAIFVIEDGECKITGAPCWASQRIYDPPPLTLTGIDAPEVGSQYSASGGAQPYVWSISCGSISETGQVTDLSGCCGSGTVTVTDACGTSASIEVRFSTGQWVEIHFDEGECWSSKPDADGECWGNGAAGVIEKVYYCTNFPGYATCTTISGRTKKVTTYGAVSQDGTYSGYDYWWVDATGDLAEDCGCQPPENKRVFAYYTTTYEWRCS